MQKRILISKNQVAGPLYTTPWETQVESSSLQCKKILFCCNSTFKILKMFLAFFAKAQSKNKLEEDRQKWHIRWLIYWSLIYCSAFHWCKIGTNVVFSWLNQQHHAIHLILLLGLPSFKSHIWFWNSVLMILHVQSYFNNIFPSKNTS